MTTSYILIARNVLANNANAPRIKSPLLFIGQLDKRVETYRWKHRKKYRDRELKQVVEC
jgi:hypothetical protein